MALMLSSHKSSLCVTLASLLGLLQGWSVFWTAAHWSVSGPGQLAKVLHMLVLI